MTKKNSESERPVLSHNEARPLFPLNTVPGTIYRHRDAEIRREQTPDHQIIPVSPTGMASGYFLKQHHGALIDIRSLSPEFRATLSDRGQVTLSRYRYIRVGSPRSSVRDHSLSEYGGGSV